MLTKENLFIQDTLPHINDISLQLYKDFCDDVLLNRKFYYNFTDGTKLCVEFKEWGIYHMLSIQHIDYRIKKEDFFNQIENGLSFSDFTINKSIKSRYREQKERITMFSCVYNTLRLGNAFYLPSGKVKNTKNVSVDYILYRTIDNKGMNLGIRCSDNIYVPLTILISKAINTTKYLDESELKIVQRLTITDISENVIETLSYALSETATAKEIESK